MSHLLASLPLPQCGYASIQRMEKWTPPLMGKSGQVTHSAKDEGARADAWSHTSFYCALVSCGISLPKLYSRVAVLGTMDTEWAWQTGSSWNRDTDRQTVWSWKKAWSGKDEWSGTWVGRRSGLPRWREWSRICLPVQETWELRVRSLGREDPPEKAVATHSSILAWKIPRTEEPGGL